MTRLVVDRSVPGQQRALPLSTPCAPAQPAMLWRLWTPRRTRLQQATVRMPGALATASVRPTTPVWQVCADSCTLDIVLSAMHWYVQHGSNSGPACT
jgi:hypothetical protein